MAVLAATGPLGAPHLEVGSSGRVVTLAPRSSFSVPGSHPSSGRPTFQQQTHYKVLFPDKKTSYRIPSLVYIESKKIFLAFAEKRKTCNDTDADDLVMRKWKVDISEEWEDMKVLSEAKMSDHRCMNPCAVYVEKGKENYKGTQEQKKGIIYLFFNCIPYGVSEEQQIREGKNQAKLCYISSADYGKTWKKQKDITNIVAGFDLEKIATFSVSPGHGIQLNDGTVVLPAYAYMKKNSGSSENTTQNSGPYSFFFYSCGYKENSCSYLSCFSSCFSSEDPELTWRASKFSEKSAGECQVAEVTIENEERIIYCNARTLKKESYRAEFKIKIKNIKEDFCYVNEKCLPESENTNGCQGSVVSFPALSRKEINPQDGSQWLLYSHPTTSEREKLGVYLNKNPSDPKSWSNPWVISNIKNGYSDLVYFKGKTNEETSFACLFEKGENDYWDEIGFCHFNINQVLDGIKQEKSANE
ncbi:sialidase-3-like [Protopterus annectens]|uniref:sialidase-3-like n=1 Tax=Protopterus annectens TaxID=7888 RepID=UPI001CF9C2A9|nr:sialidase-3-like [Protopterus annectens]